MPEKGLTSEIERALLGIARSLGRRNLGRMMERRLKGLVDFSHVAIVDTLGEDAESGGSVTVGQIAKRVELDHSRASRMVTAAIRAGYARRVASQEDGRRTCVALTDKGEEFAGAIRNLRHKYFAAHLKGWSDGDRREFARLLSLFLRGAKADRGDRKTRSEDHLTSASGENVVVLRPKLARKNRRRRRQA